MRTIHAKTRRHFLVVSAAGIGALPLAGLLHPEASRAADLPKLSLEDPTAKALNYVEQSTTEGQQCNNCQFWQGGDVDWGPCPLFPGKSVSAQGWCKSWTKKA